MIGSQPLSEQEVNTLATYNSEIARGIMHTDQWRAQMADLQARYNNAGWTPRRRRKLRIDRG